MTSGLRIVPMDASLAVSSAELEARCFPFPWRAGDIIRASLDNGYFIAALYDGEYAGHAGMITVLDEGQICNIAVTEDKRRLGIGSALVDALKSEAERRGLSVLMLEVRASNSAARALYEKKGFEIVGTRRDYYEKLRENGILYNCIIQK